MKKLFTCFFLISVLNFSQTYLNISYNNDDDANSTGLSQIQKITFTLTDLNFLLTGDITGSKPLSTIDKMTFSLTDGGNPLPIELTSFTASVNGNEVILMWRTDTEVDNYGFDVERESNVKSEKWEKIGFVQGYGNSNSPKQYEFVDIPKGGITFQYRLKQIDTDGKYSYSEVVSIDIRIPSQYSLKQNYPNPFNPSTKIAYSIPKEGLVTLKVFDVLGREVALLVNKTQQAGNYEVIYDGSMQASGAYICKMSSGNYTSSIKMLLIK